MTGALVISPGGYRWDGTGQMFLGLLSLTLHALIVMKAAQVWVTWQRTSGPLGLQTGPESAQNPG